MIMSLAPFSIIVAIDSNGGIAREGQIPWSSTSDMKFFRDVTVGHGSNLIIMGRLTYESIPKEFRPLKKRTTIVVSREWLQEEHPEVTIARSFLDALSLAGGRLKSYGEIFVAGGESIYKEAVQDFLYLCQRIYITKFKTDYECDQFFPWEEVRGFPTFKENTRTKQFVRYFLNPQVKHQEYQYLELGEKILDMGDPRLDRTGVGTRSLFGVRMEFDISKRIPILTTKKIKYENIIKELLFFISGKTDTKILEDQGVKIWSKNTSREFLDERGLTYEEGDAGPIYGYQWRHWGAEYRGANEVYTGEGIDQIGNLIQEIRSNPTSRRLLLSAWNVSDLPKMALPPCHFSCQFYVSGDRKYLDCQLYQRSGDYFLGVPYNIVSYSILTYMIAHVTGLRPRKFIHIIGDVHIYSNHEAQVRKQMKRTPRPFPVLRFLKSAKLKEIDDFDFDNFVVENYSSYPFIVAKMAEVLSFFFSRRRKLEIIKYSEGYPVTFSLVLTRNPLTLLKSSFLKRNFLTFK